MHNETVQLSLYLCICLKYLCNGCYIFVYLSMDYTKKIIGFSAAHTPHCICVFSRYGFKCVFVFLLFCICLLTIDITKTEAQPLAVHRTTISRNKSDQQHQQQLKYVSSAKQIKYKKIQIRKHQFLRALTFGIGCNE